MLCCTRRSTLRGILLGGARLNRRRKRRSTRRGILRTSVRRHIAFALLAPAGFSGVQAEQATVAVAANFAWPMAELEAVFESAAEHELTTVRGSTRQLYTQIVNGAPYDVFLAADREHPRRLAQEGAAVEASRFTYALGRLALWTREPEFTEDLTVHLLAGGEFRRLAIANPRLAPYGAAAKETLESMGLWESLRPKIVLGENAGQAFAMVETRNAELGLIALSGVVAYSGSAAHVPVPPEHHSPILQDAILLTRGQNNAAARAFVSFLRRPQARRIIAEAGYELP